MNDRPVRIIPDTKYPNMFRLQWEDGTISVGSTDPKPWEKGGHYGFYNESWANEILRNYDYYVEQMDKRSRMSKKQPRQSA